MRPFFLDLLVDLKNLFAPNVWNKESGLLSVFPKVSIFKLRSSALCLAAANQRDEDVGKNEINTFQTRKV